MLRGMGLVGTGFGPYINTAKSSGLPLRYVFLSLKGTGFSPYIQETKRWALAL
jgi:hypothetical protein